jgi:hypothetical protein
MVFPNGQRPRQCPPPPAILRSGPVAPSPEPIRARGPQGQNGSGPVAPKAKTDIAPWATGPLYRALWPPSPLRPRRPGPPERPAPPRRRWRGGRETSGARNVTCGERGAADAGALDVVAADGPSHAGSRARWMWGAHGARGVCWTWRARGARGVQHMRGACGARGARETRRGRRRRWRRACARDTTPESHQLPRGTVRGLTAPTLPPPCGQSPRRG